MFGGRVTNFLASLWGGPFFKNAFEGRATIFLAHKYSVSIYLKSSNSQFSLLEPTVSVLSNYTCKHGGGERKGLRYCGIAVLGYFW